MLNFTVGCTIVSVFDSPTSKSFTIIPGVCVYFKTFATENCFRIMLYRMSDTKKNNNLMDERLHVIFDKNQRHITNTHIS